MDSEIRAFLRGWFSDETRNDQDVVRRGILGAAPEYREKLRAGLAELIGARRMTADEFFEATWRQVDDEDEVYRLLTEAYDSLFGEGGPEGLTAGRRLERGAPPSETAHDRVLGAADDS
jgi:hypothetical protein